MSFVRRALATAAFVAIAVIPGATALATADTPDIVRDLATNGAHLVAEESELLGLAQSGGLSPADLAEAIRTDVATTGKLIRETGIRAE